MKNGENGTLYDLIGDLYDRCSQTSVIQPTWLATQAMKEIGADRETNPRWYLAAHLEFRQIARGFCQRRPDPVEAAQEDLFSDTLQDRYPCAPRQGEEPSYVLRDHMTEADVRYNVMRMRKTVAALREHANLLEDWGNRRFGREAAD